MAGVFATNSKEVFVLFDLDVGGWSGSAAIFIFEHFDINHVHDPVGLFFHPYGVPADKLRSRLPPVSTSWSVPEAKAQR
jgi:hypothetical protein